MPPDFGAGLSMADARLSLYYQDESSDPHNRAPHEHQSLSANESSHSEVAPSGEEQDDGDGHVRPSSSTDGDIHNAEDNNHLVSHSSSSDEESDENWESLDYVR